MIQADLRGADLTGADLTDANVDGADFDGAIGLNTIKGRKTLQGQCNNCEI